MKEKTVRITIDLHEQAYARLNRLVETVGAPSKSKVVREAIMLYAKAVEAQQSGGKLMMKAPGEPEVQLLIPLMLFPPEALPPSREEP